MDWQTQHTMIPVIWLFDFIPFLSCQCKHIIPWFIRFLIHFTTNTLHLDSAYPHWCYFFHSSLTNNSRIHNSISNILSCSFALADNSKHFSLLSSKIASYGIQFLDTRKLPFFQSILLQQIRLFLRLEQLVLRNKLMLCDIDDQFVLLETLND